MMEITEMKKKLKKELDKNRYEHTKGVMYTAGCIAMAHGYDYKKAMLAGLLHDCAKCIPTETKFELCEKYHVILSESEVENPSLIHAKLGAALAEHLYEVTDPEILHAIKVHTTGMPDMSLLDKILFVADYMEPGRNEAPNLEVIRELAFGDLDACVAQILYDTLKYLSGKKGAIDPMTEMTYKFYKDNRKETVL